MFVVLIRPLDVGGRSQSECDMQNIKPHGMPLIPASPEVLHNGLKGLAHSGSNQKKKKKVPEVFNLDNSWSSKIAVLRVHDITSCVAKAFALHIPDSSDTQTFC